MLHVSTRSSRLKKKGWKVKIMSNNIDELRNLASEVGQVAYAVHKYFGNGLLEKVYENALAHRFLGGATRFLCRTKRLYIVYTVSFLGCP